MKKKNILFIMNSLNCGGAEKALISLLDSFDYKNYNVDLFLFKHEGIFMSKIPKEVTLLDEPENFTYFDMPFKKSISDLISQKKIKIALNRIILGYLAKTEKNSAVIEQKMWKYLKGTMDCIQKEYDIAIGFLEKNPIYFCVENVKAKKKIGWIHTDYNKLGIDFSFEKQYFNKLDYINTVSDELVNILKGNFPESKEKFKCIHNIISPKTIKKMSIEKVDIRRDARSTSLIYVGRLVKEKGLDITLEAVDILIKKGFNLTWYLIGEGNFRTELEKGILEKGLAGKIILLGLKENPYPYIRQADIYIQTSRFEGKSISIEEAKVLAKPILITNFDTASNHIQNEENGIISKMDPVSVANQLEKIINDEQLRNKFVNNLKKEDFGRENEIKKLYQLIDG